MNSVTPLNSDCTVDPNLFDEASFRKRLVASKTPLKLFKEALKKGKNHIEEILLEQHDSRELVQQHCLLVDRLLLCVWEHNIHSKGLSLVAVGGYGRGELCPGSDIDLLILSKRMPDEKSRSEIQLFLNMLWDMGLEPGHSVRTVKDCAIEAKADITVITNLMESRFLAGQHALFESMTRAIAPRKIWSSKKFFKAKLEEQNQRHATYNNSEHKLEPNIKESPGGLRDIQMVGWVAKRHFDVRRLHELIQHGFLTREEYETLSNARYFLWRVRYVLHIITGRREDRLLFEHQRNVARHFGYESKDNSGVEQFMKLYYQTVVEIARMNKVLLQHFEEAILPTIRLQRIKKINRRFQTRNNYIEVQSDDIFKRYPFALLEIFLLIQQNRKIKGVRSSTVRLIWEHLYLIDDSFREDLRCKSLFLEILRQPRKIGEQLRRMHRFGILGRFIPAFGKVEGLMQFDLFHVYTVDEHTLFVVTYARYFSVERNQERYPLAYELMQKIPRQELLYLACLFHDIAKGRGGDHSKLGAIDAYEFCEYLGLSKYDCKLVSWLVENHLIMSRSSQKQDLDNPVTIDNFTKIVSDRERLNYLYLLTVADMNGTNPKSWNSWNASLLDTLYRRALHNLRQGDEQPLDRDDRIDQVKTLAIESLQQKDQQLNYQLLWDSLEDDYFLRHNCDEISWHATKILPHKKSRNAKRPLIQIRETTTKGGTEIFIYMENHDNIFAVITRCLNQLGLNVVDARIITTKDSFVLDTFIVLEKSSKVVKGNERKREIRDALSHALKQMILPTNKIRRMSNKKLNHFNVPTVVRMGSGQQNRYSVLEVIAIDHPGVLSAIALAIQLCGVRVHGAKIATYGERIEDIFYVCDENNQVITDPIKIECLETSIARALHELSHS